MGKIDLSNVIFIGLRDSDAQFTNFYKRLTVLGSGENGNISLNKLSGVRYNYNSFDSMKPFANFFDKHMRAEIAKNENVRFCFYNKRAIYYNPVDLQKYCCFGLPEDLVVNKLENKFNARELMKGVVNCLEYKFLTGEEIDYEKCLALFGEQRGVQFVLQEKTSSGGAQTFLLSENNYDEIKKLINPNELYSISICQQNCIPINVHFLISNTNYIMLPPSIQLINTTSNMFEYMGCDFPAYKTNISKAIKNKVEENVYRVCELLQKLGYRGIGGIDFIVVGDEIYFMEINPRFQASTLALNYALHDNNLPTMNELDAMCFMCESVPEIKDLDVSYSKTSGYQSVSAIKCDLPMIKILDGYDENEKLEDYAYKYSILYRGSILNKKHSI